MSTSSESGFRSSVCFYADQILESLLIAGIPLSKVDDLRSLMSRLRVDMGGSSKLKEYIEFAQAEERLRITGELDGQHYSVAFDGSPVNGQVRGLRF